MHVCMYVCVCVCVCVYGRARRAGRSGVDRCARAQWALRDVLDRGRRVVDVGAGTGFYVTYLRRMG